MKLRFKKNNRNLQYQIFKMVLSDKTAFIGILGMGALTGILVYFVLFPIGIPVPGVIHSVSRHDLPPEEVADSKAKQSSTNSGSSAAVATSATLEILQGSSTQGNPDFSPDVLTVKKGDAIKVVNKDSVPHTVTNGKSSQDPDSGKLFDTSVIDGGESSVIKTGDMSPGEYPYYCQVHPYMTGTLKIQ